MQHKYSFILLFTAVWIGMMLSASSEIFASSPYVAVDTAKNQIPKSKTTLTDTRNNRPQDLKISYKEFTPFTFNYKADQTSSKILSNVKVFPIPVTDQINLAFRLSKDIKVTIKIMDALGNEIMTLLSQRLSAGDQSQGFIIDRKLNSGYYFIRVMAGTETIVKRIQVL
jgi:hypothetical protein